MIRLPSPPPERRRALRRALLRHRRTVRAVLLVVSLAAGLSALVPGSPPTRSVVVATADLSEGQVLRPSDLAVVGYPPGSVPDGAYPTVASAVGRSLSSPLRRAEPLTDARIVAPTGPGTPAGLVEAAVRLADAGAAELVRPGDVVDILAADDPSSAAGYDPALGDESGEPAGGSGEAGDPAMAAVAAPSVRVLSVPDPSSLDPSGTGGALIVVAVTATTARVLAAAATRSRLSVLVRSGATQP